MQTKTGLLHNTNGGSAITPIGEADLPTPGFDSSAPTGLNAAAKGVKARAFQGGNHWDLHKMLNVKSGSEVGAQLLLYRSCKNFAIPIIWLEICKLDQLQIHAMTKYVSRI